MKYILPDRLKVGHRPLKAGILVRFQVWQQFRKIGFLQRKWRDAGCKWRAGRNSLPETQYVDSCPHGDGVENPL